MSWPAPNPADRHVIKVVRSNGDEFWLSTHQDDPQRLSAMQRQLDCTFIYRPMWRRVRP